MINLSFLEDSISLMKKRYRYASDNGDTEDTVFYYQQICRLESILAFVSNSEKNNEYLKEDYNWN